MHRAGDLKKPLKVTFVSGGVAEPAQDEGGVTKVPGAAGLGLPDPAPPPPLALPHLSAATACPRLRLSLHPSIHPSLWGPQEFFMLLMRDLFRPDYGMWSLEEHTRTYWFPAGPPPDAEMEVEYALVGAILGLAIYNGVLRCAALGTGRRAGRRVRVRGGAVQPPAGAPAGGAPTAPTHHPQASSSTCTSRWPSTRSCWGRRPPSRQALMRGALRAAEGGCPAARIPAPGTFSAAPSRPRRGPLQDLKAAFPDLGRGLQQLLDFDGDVEAVFCRK